MDTSSNRISAESEPALVIRVRMVRDETIILGPGKVELMKHIDATGSISEAAKRMRMSYNRAWLHVKVLNGAFREPLVLSLRGGKEGGGASLSPAGKKVMAIYDRMQRTAAKAAQKSGSELKAFFKK